jgi:hypothetical protein
MGKTGNYLLIDGINAVVVIPFRNLFNQYVSFSFLRKGEKRGGTLPVILGVLLAVILAAILIPLLERADSGGFVIILKFFSDIFYFHLREFVFYAVFAIPVAAYLYGLITGAAHKKGTDIIKPESVGKTVSALGILQPATVHIALGAVCGIYLVFIFSQTPYFFSAFTGRRPEGWLIYSEYARRGFFELCGISAINLALLIVGNVTSKKRRAKSRTLKVFNITLAAITLVLIATAFSKMAIYIGAYGLTMRRLLPCVLMVFLAVVFVALIVLQKKEFSIVRFALVTGSIMLCALCLSNPDAMVVRYNTDRYLSGTLREYDTEILFRARSAAVLPALEVYERTQNERLRRDILMFLIIQDSVIDNRSGHQMNLESGRAHEALTLAGIASLQFTVSRDYAPAQCEPTSEGR